MKKILFWVASIMTVILAVRIGIILVRDMGRLTHFGYGYLTGILILFLLFLTTSIWLGRKLFRKGS